MGSLALYFRLIGASVRSQMQYRVSFLMLSLAAFMHTSVELAAVWALFARFRTLRGWRLPEVALFFGIITIALAVGDAFARCFDILPRLIRSGEFDRMLIRPRSVALQLVGHELTLFRVGRASVGLAVLLWAAAALGVHWTAARVALLVTAILGGVCLFSGLWVLQATLSFWTTEGLEIMNAFTYGGCETAQYPLAIYRPWFRKFFTFVVPLACVSYFPGLAILGRHDTALGSPDWFGWVSPAIGLVFLLAALRVWRFGIRHYTSTGS